MKKYEFTIVFIDNTELDVIANTFNQALFLACAEKISKGEVFNAESIYCKDNNSFKTINKNNFSNLINQ